MIQCQLSSLDSRFSTFKGRSFGWLYPDEIIFSFYFVDSSLSFSIGVSLIFKLVPSYSIGFNLTHEFDAHHFFRSKISFELCYESCESKSFVFEIMFPLLAKSAKVYFLTIFLYISTSLGFSSSPSKIYS